MYHAAQQLPGEGAQLGEHLDHQLGDGGIAVILVRCAGARVILVGITAAGAGVDIIGRRSLLASVRIGDGIHMACTLPVVPQRVYDLRGAVAALGAGGDHQAGQNAGGLLLHVLGISVLTGGGAGGALQLREDIIHAPDHRRQLGGVVGGYGDGAYRIDHTVGLGLQEAGEAGGVHHRDSGIAGTVDVIGAGFRGSEIDTLGRLISGRCPLECIILARPAQPIAGSVPAGEVVRRRVSVVRTRRNTDTTGIRILSKRFAAKIREAEFRKLDSLRPRRILSIREPEREIQLIPQTIRLRDIRRTVDSLTDTASAINKIFRQSQRAGRRI